MHRKNKKSKSKILITGAAGFVGGHCVRSFSDAGYEVFATSRSTKRPEYLHEDIPYYSIDLVRDEIPEFEVDTCIHCAGNTIPGLGDEDYKNGNQVATLRLIEAINVKHFIYISSASVYPVTEHILMEDDVEENEIPTAYGRSKYATEQLLQEHFESEKLTVLRPRAIYGKYDTVLLPRILKLHRFNRIFLPGTCRIEVSMTSVENLMKALHQLIEHGPTKRYTYNIADDKVYVLRDVIISLLRRLAGKQLKVVEIPISFLQLIAQLNDRFNPGATMNTHSLHYMTESVTLSIKQAEREFGYVAERVFEYVNFNDQSIDEA